MSVLLGAGVNGLLLVNLGTPDSPTAPAVRRYLGEFLNDPRVLDMPAWARTLLLTFIILPFRPKRSAHAYSKIWDAERGSPLLFHSRDLTEAMQAALGDGWVVRLGMRYGGPSLVDALNELVVAGCTNIQVVPLYPQYASSTTGSTLEAVYRWASEQPWVPPLQVLPPFFDDPGYIAATMTAAGDEMAAGPVDHVVFSFHGVPESHVRATDLSPEKTHCLAQGDCCAQLTAANRACYRAQCFETARRLAAHAGLAEGTWTVSFQSRLGRVPWIRPYTDEVLQGLSQQKVENVVVLCPSFVADCLETLEEIGVQARADYKGGNLRVAPCVNAHPAWVSALADLVRGATEAP